MVHSFQLTRLLLVIAFVLSAMGAFAQNRQPVASIPFMQQAPKIDGVISDGEWKTLHISHFNYESYKIVPTLGEFWIGCDKKMIYVAMRASLNPAVGLWTYNKPTKGSGDAASSYYVGDWDDCLRLLIANNPTSTDKGEYYEIAINPLGALSDALLKNIDKIRLSTWQGKYQFKNSVIDNVWTIELAIDPQLMNIKDLTQLLGFQVIHKYNWPWEFARWAAAWWDDPMNFPRVRFTDTAPIVNEVGFQDDNGINIAYDLTNPTRSPLSVHVKIGYGQERQQKQFQEMPATLKPGETKRFAYQAPYAQPNNYSAAGNVAVTLKDGTVIFARDFTWATKPAPFFEAKPNAPDVRNYAIEWHPTPQVFRWRVNIANLPLKNVVKHIRLIIINQQTKEKITEQILTKFNKDDDNVQQVRLSGLKTGRYEAQFFLDTATPATQPVKTHIFDQETDLPWLNNTIGISDEVIPPFTPLTVTNNTVGSLLRQHTMTNTGLWAQVNAQGQDIMAGPMRFEVKQRGKVQTVNGNLQFIETKANRVTSVALWSAGQLRGKTTSDYDYDGCMKVTLQLSQQGKAKIDGMELVIPLDGKLAQLMHVCADGLRMNYGGYVPKGDGIVWTSAQASKNNLIGTFIPYLWFGGAERGLCWFASNDRDWVLDTKDTVPDLALERKGNALSLRVRLIQKPVALDRTHIIVFGLMATPVKTLPNQMNWRTWGVGDRQNNNWVFAGMETYVGCPSYSVRPLNDDYEVIRQVAQSKKTGVRNDKFWTEYIAKYPEWKAELNSGSGTGHAAGLVPYTNIRAEAGRLYDWAVYQDEWRVMPFNPLGRQTNYRRPLDVTNSQPQDFVVSYPRSRRDYLLYYYRELLKNGFDGFYWDNSCIYSSENMIDSGAYVREDGQLQRYCDVWELRDVMKRTAVLEHQMDKPFVNMVHMTNTYIVPAYSWVAYTLDWEWKYGLSEFQDRETRDYIRAATLGAKAGTIPTTLGFIIPSNAPTAKWVQRTQAGVCMVHCLLTWDTAGFYAAYRRSLDRYGFADQDVVEYHYWDENPVATVTGMDAPFLVLKCKNNIILVITDYGNGGDCQVKLDLQRLNLAPNFTATNVENAQEQLMAQGNILSIKGIKRHDFRTFIIPY